MKLPDWTIKACLFVVAFFTVMAGRGIREDPHEVCLKQIARLERELAEDGVLFCMNDVQFDREMRQIEWKRTLEQAAVTADQELEFVAARINQKIEQRPRRNIDDDPDPGRRIAFEFWRDYQNRKFYR